MVCSLRVSPATFVHVMMKRLTIILTFLAYAMALCHSFVPHHHHDDFSHEHHATLVDHDESGHMSHTSLGHLFSEAVHHPAAETFVHNSQDETAQKVNPDTILFQPVVICRTVGENKSATPLTSNTPEHYSFDEHPASPLRAPPLC